MTISGKYNTKFQFQCLNFLFRNYFLAFAVRTSKKKLRWEDKNVNKIIKAFKYSFFVWCINIQIFKQGTVATELKEEKSMNKVKMSFYIQFYPDLFSSWWTYRPPSSSFFMQWLKMLTVQPWEIFCMHCRLKKNFPNDEITLNSK